jgi:hypothetical protein
MQINLSTLVPTACQVGSTVGLPQKEEEEEEEEGGFMKFQEQNELTIHSNIW